MLGKITIALADDHKIVRDGLKSFLSKIPDFEIVAEVADGEQLIDVYEDSMPDVALVDIAMPRMNG